MTDLVSRLRERHSFLCDEAAEEIERLHGIIADNSLLNRTDNERLRGLLGEAADDIEHWGGYASEYFKDKWHLEDDIKKYRDAALAGEPATEPAKTADQPSACNHFPGQSTCEWCGAVQPERCCLDYPRCDCNSPPEPDNEVTK